LAVLAAEGEQTIEVQEGNRILFVELPASEREVEVVVTFEAERRRCETAAPSDVPYVVPPADLKEGRHLRADARVPTDGQFAAEALSLVESDTTPLRKARVAFEHVLATYAYDSSGCTPDKGDGIGDLHVACDLKTGTCTDLHGLLVSFLRTLGVPARFAFGFNVPKRPEGTIAGYHCWSEVFLPEVGWFPIDVSEARKRDPGPERQFYFGNLDENRVQFSRGRDLTLVPAQRCGPVDKFIFPYAECGTDKIVAWPAFSFRSL
jgi:transglutaminase-like putative cysteine protease